MIDKFELVIPQDEHGQTICEEVIVEQYEPDDLIFVTQNDEDGDGVAFTATHMLTVKQARILRNALNQIFGDL